MKRKIILLAAIIFGCTELISFDSVEENKTTNGGGSQYEMNPPITTSISIQKLPTPLADGSTLKMMVQFTFPDPTIPSTVDVYTGNALNSKITFRDDGTGPDLIASDGTYTAYLNENINALENELQSRVAAINSRPVNLLFNAHDGTELTTAITINLNSFNAGNVMNIPTPLFVGLDCADAIDKSRSLFITDTSVVEDDARTYNFINSTGNYNGLYTFGHMFKEIAGDYAVSGVTPKQLLKSWVQNWTMDITVAGQTVAQRGDVFTYLIGPWLNKAGVSGIIDPTNWSNKWDSANEDALLRNAPFKLLAIVNRIDLRGNSGFNMLMTNTGETRFIYTLIAPYAVGVNTTVGNPPAQENQSTPNFNFHDWRGMNVIFEYGNLPTNICDTRSLAQQWLALSSMTLGSAAYKDALENITKLVIQRNAAPGKTNHSAIDRIRTNERLFYRPADKSDNSWKASNWEFRQFELDGTTHLFKQVPLTNTPILTVNDEYSYYGSKRGNLTSEPATNTTGVTTASPNFTDWAFSTPFIKASILRGNYIIPNMYGTSQFLAASGLVDGKWAHYFDFTWSSRTPHYDSSLCWDLNLNDWPAQYEQMRHQISLNTCQGCHNGETKTLFTQVAPLGYGVTDKYWMTTADSLIDNGMDRRFSGNGGFTVLPNAIDSNYMPPPNDANCYPKISGFLTGRDFKGLASPGHSGPVTFFDDKTNDADDNNLNGLYYVNSPANCDTNRPSGMFSPPKQIAYQYGYNDLQRRAQDMCTLINSSCGISVMNIGTVLMKRPFPLASH